MCHAWINTEMTLPEHIVSLPFHVVYVYCYISKFHFLLTLCLIDFVLNTWTASYFIFSESCNISINMSVKLYI